MYSKFNEIYEKIYKENYEELEKLRKNKLIGALVIISAFILGIIYLLISQNVIFTLLLFILLMFISITIFKVDKYNITYKTKVIRKLVKSYNKDLDFYPNKGISSNSYRQGEFETYDIYTSEDLIEGVIDNCHIQMAEVKTQDEIEDDDGNKTKSTIFHGMFGVIELNNYIKGTIKVRKNNFLSGLFYGKDKLEMDSSELEKYFDVFADDKIQAMQIFTADIIAEMLDYYNKYKISYEITIKGNKLYIRFKSGEMFEGNILKSSLDMDTIKKNYDLINFIFNLTKLLANTIKDKEL